MLQQIVGHCCIECYSGLAVSVPPGGYATESVLWTTYYSVRYLAGICGQPRYGPDAYAWACVDVAPDDSCCVVVLCVTSFVTLLSQPGFVWCSLKAACASETAGMVGTVLDARLG